MLRFTWLCVPALLLVLVAVAPAQKADAPPPVKLTIPGQPKGTHHVTYSPDGKHLACSCKDGTVRIWDAAIGKEVAVLKGHTARVFSSAYSPDGKWLVSAGGDKMARLWDLSTNKEKAAWGHSDEVYHVQFSPDGKYVAAGTSDNKVYLWDVATNKALTEAKTHSHRVYSVAFTPEGDRLVTACGTNDANDPGGEVKVFAVPAMAELYTLPVSSNAGVMCLAFDARGRRLAGACLNGTVHVWEFASGQECSVLKGHTLQCYGVSFSPDGSRVASVSGRWNQDTTPGEVKVWDLASGKELTSFPAHAMTTWTVAFAPGGKQIATACGKFSKDEAGEVKVWDLSALPAPAAAAAPTAAQLDALWADLADKDGSKAYRAVTTLAASPKQSTPFLLDKATCPPLGARERIPQLVRDLDSENFKTRESATEELERLGSLAFPALQKALAETKSAEVKRRARALLERKGEPPAPNTEELRATRVLEVMEMIGDSEAKKVIEKLAKGPKDSPIAQDAARVLKKLEK